MDIRLQGVSKIFPPDIRALEDIYLSIPQGEFVYLVGTTGSGKTTLLRLISREAQVTRGQIYAGSYNLKKIPTLSLAIYRRDIGVVFQDFKLLPDLTVVENVAFVLEVIGVPPREIAERVGEVLERVGMWRRRFLRPPQLSGGEQQRVAIARAVINSPAVLLADEPTGNLDTKTSEEIMNLFTGLNGEGKTIILVTHEPDVAEYSRRTLVFRDGRLIDDERREPRA